MDSCKRKLSFIKITTCVYIKSQQKWTVLLLQVLPICVWGLKKEAFSTMQGLTLLRQLPKITNLADVLVKVIENKIALLLQQNKVERDPWFDVISEEPWVPPYFVNKLPKRFQLFHSLINRESFRLYLWELAQRPDLQTSAWFFQFL